MAIADVVRIRGLLNGLDYAGREIDVADHLDLDLRNHVRRIFSAAIDFGLPLLAAKPLHFAHRHAGDAQRGKCLADIVMLERLDDRLDKFHVAPCYWCAATYPAKDVPIQIGRVSCRAIEWQYALFTVG